MKRGLQNLEEHADKIRNGIKKRVSVVEDVVRNPRRVKRILVRYMRIIEEWNAQNAGTLVNDDGFRDPGLWVEVILTLGAAIALMVLREVRPDFFELFIKDQEELAVRKIKDFKRIVDSACER